MILQSKVVLPPVGNVSLLVNNIPVRVEGLIGTATTEKDGLSPKEIIPYWYDKGNGVIAKLTINTTAASNIHASILTICSVFGNSLAIYLIANKWNNTVVSAKIICGTTSWVDIKLYYVKESNGNISIYIQSELFLRIYVSPQNGAFNPLISSLSSLPSGTTEVTIS